MNFSVYIHQDVGTQLTKVAKSMHRSRNSIINEALEEWLGKHLTSSWPKNFFNFDPIDEVPDFKALRSDLIDNVAQDPLA